MCKHAKAGEANLQKGTDWPHLPTMQMWRYEAYALKLHLQRGSRHNAASGGVHKHVLAFAHVHYDRYVRKCTTWVTHC